MYQTSRLSQKATENTRRIIGDNKLYQKMASTLSKYHLFFTEQFVNNNPKNFKLKNLELMMAHSKINK